MKTIWDWWTYGLAALPLAVIAYVGWRLWRARRMRRQDALARGEYIRLNPRTSRIEVEARTDEMDTWAWPPNSRFLGAGERMGPTGHATRKGLGYVPDRHGVLLRDMGFPPDVVEEAVRINDRLRRSP